MYKNILGIVAVAVSLTLSQSAFAHSWGCGEGMKAMVESLKLEDAQKEKIKPILEQLKSSMKENGTQMHDLEVKINEQVDSATMDQSVVDGLVDQKSKLIGNIMKAKAVAKNQIMMILNPQQKMDLHAKMKAVEDKMVAKYKSCHDQD